jgi:hypothetical protein
MSEEARLRENVYPYCQFGEGPRKPLYLPRDIRGLADDPYRSLAWFVRKAGGFDPSVALTKKAAKKGKTLLKSLAI